MQYRLSERDTKNMTTLNIMCPNMEVQEASHGPPGGGFAPDSSLNIYFESDIGGSACLYPSKHKGHECFLSEAESCKEKFLASMQEGRYFECTDVVTALAYKLMEKGSIYERKLGNQNLLQGQQWQPVSGLYNVRDLVLRALLTHYKANTNAVPASTDETSDVVAVLAAMPLQKLREYKEKANTPLVGGPEWLLQAALPNVDAHRRPMNFKRYTIDVSQNDKVTASKSPKSPDKLGQLAIASPSSSSPQNSQLQVASQGRLSDDCIAEAKTNDVICGDRNEDGVPKIGHVGNVLFHQRISTMAAEFAKASTVQKGKYAMKCADMVRQLSGRFLVKVCEAESAMKKPRFTELSLQDARWRVYWALEKSQITAPATKRKAKKSKTSADKREADASIRSRAASPAKTEPGRGDGKTLPVDSKTGREPPPPIVLKHIPTHLTFVSEVNTAAPASCPSAAKSGEGPVSTTVSVSSSGSSKEQQGSSTSTTNKADRARRRREKFQHAKDILAGRLSDNPLEAMEQLRRASIEELKKRQKRTQVRKRLATWDPDAE